MKIMQKLLNGPESENYGVLLITLHQILLLCPYQLVLKVLGMANIPDKIHSQQSQDNLSQIMYSNMKVEIKDSQLY